MSENTVVNERPVQCADHAVRVVRGRRKDCACRRKAGALSKRELRQRQYVYHPDRILYPMKQIGKKGEGHFERITWEEAYEMMAERLRKIKRNLWTGISYFLCGLSEMESSGSASACECIWFTEFLHGIKYMFSGSRSGVEVELWWSHLHARFEKCENSSCVGVQSLSLTDSIQQDVA